MDGFSQNKIGDKVSTLNRIRNINSIVTVSLWDRVYWNHILKESQWQYLALVTTCDAFLICSQIATFRLLAKIRILAHLD